MATVYQFGAANWPSQLPIIGISSVLPSRLSPLNSLLLRRKASTPMLAPVCSESVTSYQSSDLKFYLLAELLTLPGTSTAELLFELLLLKSDRSKAQSERILVYLASAEQSEEDVWLRDDIRIAWITVLNAANGVPEPHVSATYRVLGLHPSKVWQAILARREAVLGPPKKQPEPVPLSKAARSAL